VRTIAHLSDITFDRYDASVGEALIREINDLPAEPDRVSGDLTQRARVYQFRQAMAFLAKLPGPQMLLRGKSRRAADQSRAAIDLAARSVSAIGDERDDCPSIAMMKCWSSA